MKKEEKHLVDEEAVLAVPSFFKDLMKARSPSGYEQEAQCVVDSYMKSAAEVFEKDALGNRIMKLNPDGDPVLMFSGHMDELGLILTHITKDGFLFFDTLGGHDKSMIPGRRVRILSSGGDVSGVTGKRAVHLMDSDERKKVPEMHQLWIDIGAKDKDDALKRVSIGDPVVYVDGLEPLSDNIVTGRAMDNRAGAYVVCEVLRRLAQERSNLEAQVVSVATTQEEVGVRGATVTGYAVDPHLALAVDVTHATDHPECNPCKHGDIKLGKGPVIARGPNINPFVYERLIKCCKDLKLPYQLEADGRPTGTDARAIQMSRGGVATGLVSIPLRYMHTPSEVIHLQDLENAVLLLCAFAHSLKRGEHGLF